MKNKVKKILCASVAGAVCFGLGVTFVSLDSVNADTVDFDMKAGASVRLNPDSTGIRFIAEMNEETYNSVIDASGETPVYKTGMSLGMVIVPTSYIAEAPAGTTDWLSYLGDKKKLTLEIPAEKVYKEGDNYCFNGVMTDIAFNSMALDFIGIGYSFNGTAYDYADFNIEDNSRSVALVASRALNDPTAEYGPESTAVLQNYITKSLYREAGVYAYESAEETLYYASYEAYKADTDRVGGETDIDVVASELGYSLSYIDVVEELNFTLADGEATIDVTAAVEGADYSNLIEWSSSNTNVATVVNGKVTAVATGETVITAKLFGKEYKTNVGVVTKYIANATDFAAIANTPNGYYVLTSDVDFGGETVNSLFAETAGVENHSPEASVGFRGVLDGRGYAIKNMNLASSLFGVIGRTGVVKNVSVSTNKLTGGAVLAKYHYGVIDNVQVTVASTGADNTSTYAAYGLVAEVVQGWSGAQFQYGVISNVYVNATKLFYATWGERALVVRWDQGYYAKFANIVVVANQFNETYLPIVKTKNASSQYENNAAYTATTGLTAYNFSATGFNDYWVIDENNVPALQPKVVAPVEPTEKPTETIAQKQLVSLAAGQDFVMNFTESVKSVTVGTTAITSFTANGATLTIPFAQLSNIAANDYVLTIETANKYYVADIAIATKVLMNADFVTSSENMTGYYVLGENITLSGVFDGLTSGTFSGILDGNGYTISGGKVKYGILGKNTMNATVKNLAINGVGVSASPDNTNLSIAGLLAHTMDGTTTLENLFLNMNNPDNWASNVGVWAYCVKGTLNATNVVSYVQTDRANMSSLVSWLAGGTLNLTNAYCGSAVNMNLIVTGAPATINATQYTSLVAMQEAYAAGNIDVAWAQNLGFYAALTGFLTA